MSLLFWVYHSGKQRASDGEGELRGVLRCGDTLLVKRKIVNSVLLLLLFKERSPEKTKQSLNLFTKILSD